MSQENENSVKVNSNNGHCLRCKRPLKNPIYRKIGYGKVCLGKCSTITVEEKTRLETLIKTLQLEKKNEKK
ncbi:MAG: hypothetical protein WC934_02875 [Acidithiobacillus sp.]|jgi:predicted acetyltransferase|uniref:hypothetical protein n=1 Tax=Acidithiobacillus sp. TaxID=1872118 RepID=UPI00355FC6F3